jgi:hypothetical protein
MRRATWVVLTGFVVTACACEAPDAPESLQQPIVAGAPDTGDPAIMELLSNKGQLWARCTATLVTPRVLLTAAHCFVETPGFRHLLFPRNDDTNFTEQDLLPLQATAFDPGYRAPRQGHDFGIVVLASPLPMRPMPINRAPVDRAQGKTIRYVGYGLVTGGNPGSGGVKRNISAPIAQVTGTLIAVAAGAHGSCQGDSGGPMLLDDGHGEAIVGIASFVDKSTCVGNSFYQRVDTQLAWVDEQIAKYDPGGGATATDAGARDEGGVPSTVDAGPADALTTPGGAGDAQRPADGTVLPPDKARDAAAPDDDGGIGPGEGQRTVPPGAGATGCSYGGAGRPWLTSALLLGAALDLARRRRARVKAVAALLGRGGPRAL